MTRFFTGKSFARQSRSVGIVFLTVIVVLSFLTPATPAQAQALAQGGGDGKFETTSCMFKMPAGWVEGKDVSCGYLTVPEEHNNPTGKTIQLAVAIVKSTNPNPPADPIVMLQGGPGGSTIDTYTQLLPLQGKTLRANRDIILFDQRGTLYSKPSLVCPEYLDMTIKYLDVKLTPEKSDEAQLQAMTACRTRLAKEGVNLSAYNSIENALDVDSLRQALGYQKINLYGVSYGTLLALHTMSQAPEGLRTVILDSTVPPQINFLLDAPTSENRSFEALFAACSKDAACQRAYPDLRQVFYDQVDRLNQKPVHIQITDVYSPNQTQYQALLDGDTLLSTVFQMMYNTDIIPMVPRTIYDVIDGNYATLERLLSVIVFDKTMSMGMYFSVMCTEDADFNPNDVKLNGLPKQIVEVEKDSGPSFINTCKMWNVKDLGPQIDKPVTSDIPTLILSGAFDPITPPAYGETAANTLPKSYFFLFPNGGHGEALTGTCPDTIMTEFLDNPNQKPTSDCINTLGGPKFITPATIVHLPYLSKMLNLQGTSGIELLLYLLGLLFLLTAVAIYPIVWLVRLFSKKPQQPAYPAYPTPAAGYPGEYGWNEPQPVAPIQPVNPPVRRPGLYRFAPWLASLAGLVLLGFTVVLIVILVNMITNNDTLLLVGLPGSARPLFILPIIAAILAVLMLLGALIGWVRGAGSVWGRLYLTLLSGAALVCVVILALWGMMAPIFNL